MIRLSVNFIVSHIVLLSFASHSIFSLSYHPIFLSASFSFLASFASGFAPSPPLTCPPLLPPIFRHLLLPTLFPLMHIFTALLLSFFSSPCFCFSPTLLGLFFASVHCSSIYQFYLLFKHGLHFRFTVLGGRVCRLMEVPRSLWANLLPHFL